MQAASNEIKDLTNRVCALISAALSPSRIWLPYLVDPVLDCEPELRNKILCLYVTSIIDATSEYETRLHGISITSAKQTNATAQHYVYLLTFFLESMIDVVSVFARDEMIFISELRHQYVHGRWDEINKQSRLVRFVANGRVIKSKLDADEYWAEFRNCSGIENGNSLDARLESLRANFTTRSRCIGLSAMHFQTRVFCHGYKKTSLRHGNLA